MNEGLRTETAGRNPVRRQSNYPQSSVAAGRRCRMAPRRLTASRGVAQPLWRRLPAVSSVPGCVRAAAVGNGNHITPGASGLRQPSEREQSSTAPLQASSSSKSHIHGAGGSKAQPCGSRAQPPAASSLSSAAPPNARPGADPLAPQPAAQRRLGRPCEARPSGRGAGPAEPSRQPS